MSAVTKMLLKTALSPRTGYGRDGIDLARSLRRFGIDPRMVLTHVEVPLHVEVAALLTQELDPPFDVVLQHTDPGQAGFTRAERESSWLAVLWTMWEFPRFPDFVAEGETKSMQEKVQKSVDGFDAVLVYDDTTKAAFETLDHPPLLKLQGGYDSAAWKPTPLDGQRDWGGTFRFCMVGMLHNRKQPYKAIRAFKALKDEYGDDFDAELHLKTLLATFHPAMEEWCPGLKIHLAHWDVTTLRRFYLRNHVLLAPSWGEGKNLPALEMMTTGGTVIVSDTGGHREWLSEDWGYGISGVMRDDLLRGMPVFDADEDELKRLMWETYTNRDEARQKGAIAARTIPAMCDWEPVTRRLLEVLSVTSQREGIRERVGAAQEGSEAR